MQSTRELKMVTPPQPAWVDDIKPVPTKQRAPQGIVDISISEEQTVRLVGVVYGLEHDISGEGYQARLMLDHYNQRVKILSYEGPDIPGLVQHVKQLADANSFDKIIVMAPRRDWQRFLRFGYVLEAVVSYYLQGEDAFVMSKFGSQERLTSVPLMEETHLIERVMENDVTAPVQPLPAGHTVRLARKSDVPALLELYAQIFESYPSPLVYEGYLESVFQKETLFAVCAHGDRIVAAASAELAMPHRAAELTDCATTPEARGKGLMSHILTFLEEELVRRRYLCAYTMARARSFGMNNVFHRLGYEFSGRLVNNCDIYGAFEDMNIWVKRLSLPPEITPSTP